MTTAEAPAVAVLPLAAGYLARVVTAGGGGVVDPEATAILVWADPADDAGLGSVLAEHPTCAGCSCRGPGSSRTST